MVVDGWRCIVHHPDEFGVGRVRVCPPHEITLEDECHISHAKRELNHGTTEATLQQQGCLIGVLAKGVGQRVEHVVTIFVWTIRPEVSIDPMLECVYVNESRAIKGRAH